MRVLTGVRTSEQLAELAKAFKADWLAERVELTPKQLLSRDYSHARRDRHCGC